MAHFDKHTSVHHTLLDRTPERPFLLLMVCVLYFY